MTASPAAGPFRSWKSIGYLKTILLVAWTLVVWVTSGLVMKYCGEEEQKPTRTKDEPSPLRGESPTFTVVPMTSCTSELGPFCDQWRWCNSSMPKLSAPQKLWDVHVVSGKDGPALVCEWRAKKDER